MKGLTTRKIIGAFNHYAVLSGMVMMLACTANLQAQNDGGAITQAELQQNGYPYPTDLVAGANETQLANYAWRLFIASMQQTTATLSSGAGRGVASTSNNFIGTGSSTSVSNPLVFESLYHRTEAFPYYATASQKPASPINQVPTYYTYSLNSSCDRVAFTVSGANYVNLDETNQIGQNFLYYRNSNSPDFPVLFMAKVNAAETNYAWDKMPPSNSSSWVFPNNVLEVKTAWRRVSDINISSPSAYHQAEATYYVGEENQGNPTVETDTFALIAIHIIQKTANYQHFIFTTFEHVDAVIREGGVITDPAFQLTYTNLAYDPGSTNPHTAAFTGAYSVNAPGQPSQGNMLTPSYTLPNSGAQSTGYITVVQPKTIAQEVNDVNNMVAALITGISGQASNIWANYRLKGVQAVPTSNQEYLNYYLANIVVESSQPGIQLFHGNAGGGLPVNGTFTNNRESLNISSNLVEGQPVPAPTINMGGCQGCHGVAQQRGRDFSFLAQAAGGNGKEVDSVPSEGMTFMQRAIHNERMSRTNNYDD